MHTGSTFIVMRGFPGTGKSTIARLLAAALHAPLIDRDIIRQTVVHIFGELPLAGQFSYELMFALAREQLSLGLSVVVDTPLTYRTTYEQCKELAKEFQTPMLVVHCQCPPEVQKRRLEGRKGNVVSKVAKGTFQHFKLLPGTNGSSGNLASRNMRMAVAPLIPPNQWMILWQM